MSLLKLRTGAALSQFLEAAAAVGADPERIKAVFPDIVANIRARKGDARRHVDLEARWYESVERGEPDHSVYGDQDYLAELWACWSQYSRRYLTMLRKLVKGDDDTILGVGTIIDLGCGFGYTTAGLKEIFPDASVFGTNVPGLQMEIAKKFGEQYGFTVDSVPPTGDVELVLASEYFEHFEDPITHLSGILSGFSPQFLLAANSFGATATGHFPVYKNGCAPASPKSVSRAFGALMSAAGYEKVPTGFWNNRPSLWRKA